MIKFTAEMKNGRTLIGLGLTAGNLRHMKAGRPLHVNLEEMNLAWKGEIIVIYGETEDELQEELKDFITPETKINVEKKPS
jgi:hypothetical protein